MVVVTVYVWGTRSITCCHSDWVNIGKMCNFDGSTIYEQSVRTEWGVCPEVVSTDEAAQTNALNEKQPSLGRKVHFSSLSEWSSLGRFAPSC